MLMKLTVPVKRSPKFVKLFKTLCSFNRKNAFDFPVVCSFFQGQIHHRLQTLSFPISNSIPPHISQSTQCNPPWFSMSKPRNKLIFTKRKKNRNQTFLINLSIQYVIRYWKGNNHTSPNHIQFVWIIQKLERKIQSVTKQVVRCQQIILGLNNLHMRSSNEKRNYIFFVKAYSHRTRRSNKAWKLKEKTRTR